MPRPCTHVQPLVGAAMARRGRRYGEAHGRSLRAALPSFVVMHQGPPSGTTGIAPQPPSGIRQQPGHCQQASLPPNSPWSPNRRAGVGGHHFYFGVREPPCLWTASAENHISLHYCSHPHPQPTPGAAGSLYATLQPLVRPKQSPRFFPKQNLWGGGCLVHFGGGTFLE